MEIEKAVEAADAIIVCLSKGSITKEGYVQRELRIVLDFADYKPEGTLYLMPVRLEECEPPRRLRAWQYEDYFGDKRERTFQRLLVSLKRRADSLGLKFEEPAPKKEEQPVEEKKSVIEVPVVKKELKPEPVAEKKPILETPKPTRVVTPKNVAIISNKLILSNGMEFLRIPAGKFLMGSDNHEENEKPEHTVDISYDHWMARFPVTNEFYNSYIKAKGVKHPVDDWGKKKDHPVVYVEWVDAVEYCKWLNNLLKSELPSGYMLRLPTEAEWEKAACGKKGNEFPWGNEFDKNKCNTGESGKGDTTPVGLYSPRGDSPYGCADMAGNVWEWTRSLNKKYPYKVNDDREREKASGRSVLRGGSFVDSEWLARCAYRLVYDISYLDLNIGFRVAISPKLPE